MVDQLRNHTLYGFEVEWRVEDNEGVREYAKSALEEMGHGVLAASDANEAFQLLGDVPRVDLL